MVKINSELFSYYDIFSEEDMGIINKFIPVKSFKKGTVLLQEGQISTESYIVIKGCIRSYYMVDGDERTTAFYMESESCAVIKSYINQIPSLQYLECLEDCTLSVLSFTNEQILIKKYPKFESICRKIIETNFGKNQDIFINFITKSPEERYLDLLKNKSDLLQRVPQYQLATYIGVKPESLSRIRKRIAKNELPNYLG